MPLRACILGCAAFHLAPDERAFFAKVQPLGLILFKRNADNPAQVIELIRSFRATVGRADAPVLIDQEGGRVQRLVPPNWPSFPSAAEHRRAQGHEAESYAAQPATCRPFYLLPLSVAGSRHAALGRLRSIA